MHVRSLALRMLCSLQIPTVQPVVIISIRRCADDSAPFVRKTAALALMQVYDINKNSIDVTDVCDILQKLLTDSHLDVVGAAMTSLLYICPDAYDLLHPVFRHLCKHLAEFL
uniref:AP-3 complex subunit beta-2 n=1 Tax=Lygus hesperus TaxID=30085 RepID=A0A0A9XEQ4_LYGHE